MTGQQGPGVALARGYLTGCRWQGQHAAAGRHSIGRNRSEDRSAGVLELKPHGCTGNRWGGRCRAEHHNMASAISAYPQEIDRTALLQPADTLMVHAAARM